MKLLCRSTSCVGCLQAQAEAAVKAQVQLATASTDKMAMTSCALATIPTPPNQAPTAEVTAVHAQPVAIAAAFPNKAAIAHAAAAVTGAKQGVLCSCNAIWCAAMISLIMGFRLIRSDCRGCLCSSVFFASMFKK
jgi:hypothetical protein